MKKFIKLISLVMIAVLCVGSTVFAADYNMYTNATGKLTGDVDTGLWDIKGNTSGAKRYSTIYTTSKAISINGAKSGAKTEKDYKYIVSEISVLPYENVKYIYISRSSCNINNSNLKITSDMGWNEKEWNNLKYVMTYQSTNDSAQANYYISVYINGKLAKQGTMYFVNNDSNNMDMRFVVDSDNSNVAPVAYLGTIKTYATNDSPGFASAEKVIGESYAMDGGNIYVKKGVSTVKDLCDSITHGAAKVMPEGKFAQADLAVDTVEIKDGDSLIVKNTETGIKTQYTINLDKPVVVLSGDAISSVKQNYSDGYTNIDDTKTLKVTAYAKDGGKVYLAQYDADGALLSAQAQEVTTGTFASIDFAKAENMSTVKTFLWNNTSFAPLCSTQILKPVSSASTAE